MGAQGTNASNIFSETLQMLPSVFSHHCESNRSFLAAVIILVRRSESRLVNYGF